jgi:hypothetical protein
MTTRAVCLDVMGTLFDLSAPRRRLEALGAPPTALEAWFGRLLHAAAVVTLIAAHGWDVAGARAAGLGAVWVSRLERRWPLPPPEPPAAPDLIGAADQILAG